MSIPLVDYYIYIYIRLVLSSPIIINQQGFESHHLHLVRGFSSHIWIQCDPIEKTLELASRIGIQLWDDGTNIWSNRQFPALLSFTYSRLEQPSLWLLVEVTYSLFLYFSSSISPLLHGWVRPGPSQPSANRARANSSLAKTSAHARLDAKSAKLPADN